MSLVAQTPDVELRSSATDTSLPAWFEIRREDLSLWNDVLLGTHTWLYQYPFWNEPHRSLGLTPRYLAWGTEDRPLAYLCILTIGFRPAKIGLVFRGPTCLQGEGEFPRTALVELLDWSRSQGYMFIRFTHSDPGVMSHLASLGNSKDFDAFPYFLDYPVISPDFIVDQCESEEETLAGFDREVRRKLRKAAEIGYEFRSNDAPQALQRLWPLHQECSRRKHFRLERPLSVYMEMMRLARPHNGARVYSVHLNGRAVGSTLVFRDRTSAHCVLAAFDAAHKQASVFLHWNSMRDMYRHGVRRYNLGPGSGSLARFKQQFARSRASYPGPVTVVLNQGWFRLWWKGAYPVAKLLRPTLRRIVSHVRR